MRGGVRVTGSVMPVLVRVARRDGRVVRPAFDCVHLERFARHGVQFWNARTTSRSSSANSSSVSRSAAILT